MEKIKVNVPGDGVYHYQNSLKSLRTNLQFCGQDIKVIALTSCDENEGKTTVSLSIAKSFAELDKKVLFIDADMRKSVIAGTNTEIYNPTGLSEVLSGMRSLNDCIYVTQYPKLHMLLAGQYPPNPLELLNGKYFAALLEAAKQCYDYIIIDTPPIGAVIDAAVIAQNCDGIVMVIGNPKLRTSTAQNAVKQLQKTGRPILGAVRNFVHMRREGKYGYGKYGYGKYKYGYGQ